MAQFQVNILGCGSATPSARHNPSCQVVDYRDKLFMIDCGEGAQVQFRRMGLKFSRLGHIFISHLHGDHVFGLPGLLSTMSLHGVQGTVTIHVFAEGAHLLKEWMDFFNRQSTFKLEWDIIQPGERRILYEDRNITVESFPLYHRIACTGFIFREKTKPRHLRGDMVKFLGIPVSSLQSIKDGADWTRPDTGEVITNDRLTLPPTPATSYAYCSDTLYDQRVAADIKGVANVYHEATYHSAQEATARERGHSTSQQAALTALKAGSRQLIIGHFSKRYITSEQPLLDEAASIFPATVLADEGKRIDLI